MPPGLAPLRGTHEVMYTGFAFEYDIVSGTTVKRDCVQQETQSRNPGKPEWLLVGLSSTSRLCLGLVWWWQALMMVLLHKARSLINATETPSPRPSQRPVLGQYPSRTAASRGWPRGLLCGGRVLPSLAVFGSLRLHSKEKIGAGVPSPNCKRILLNFHKTMYA